MLGSHGSGVEQPDGFETSPPLLLHCCGNYLVRDHRVNFQVVSRFCWCRWRIHRRCTRHPVIRFVYMPWKARPFFRPQKSFHRSLELSCYDIAITARDSNGRYTTPWSDFVKSKENGRLFLLYYSDLLFHMVSNEAFQSANSLSKFSSRVQNKVVT